MMMVFLLSHSSIHLAAVTFRLAFRAYGSSSLDKKKVWLYDVIFPKSTEAMLNSLGREQKIKYLQYYKPHAAEEIMTGRDHDVEANFIVSTMGGRV